MDSANSQAFEVSCWASVNWRCAKEVSKGLMSKAKWFAVRKPSTGGIIATSANQIVPPKFRGPTKMLYYIHQTPLSFCSVEGGSGDETRAHKNGRLE